MSKKLPQFVYSVPVVYLGERMETFGKITQVFRSARGRVFRYSGIKGVGFGDNTAVTKDGRIAVRPKVSEERKIAVTPEEEAEFSAHAQIVKHERARRRKQLELKKPHPDLVRAIQLLAKFTGRMDRLELSRFCQYVETELSKKGRKR